ncbi:MAG: chromosomal replication initiator protein DnaA [Actinomycetota bacterium]|nr:chromosomal replication initiator protein DnaA [Actinomycetota bacterium]
MCTDISTDVERFVDNLVIWRTSLLAQAKTSSNSWTQFQDNLREGVSKANWDTWLSRLELDQDGDVLTLVAPTEFHLRWVRDKHGDLVTAAYQAAYGAERTPAYKVSDNPPAEQPLPLGEQPEEVAPTAGTTTVPAVKPTNLISRYRFESFVVGQSNRFAWAAAMAVAEQPGAHYNPLFIYGGAGLGKTHLLNAVGHEALTMYPELVVRYVSSENFLNDFIDSIRRKRPDAFKQRYRGVDILLLDDVQFFEGKEQILEEFFHTFNSLYESGKQMVISSDRHPRNLSSLEDRLRSRFEWGLLTDIQPPDVETRLAILKSNAEFAPKPVPLDVLEYIAGLVSDNIRELEGALTRVTAWSALNRRDIDLDTAERVLRDIVATDEPVPLGPDIIIRTTAQSFGFTVEDVLSSSRRQPLVLCRQVAMYLCRELTDLSLPKIGGYFNRDHTTVLHSVEKVKRILRSDRAVFDRVNQLTQELRKGGGVSTGA